MKLTILLVCMFLSWANAHEANVWPLPQSMIIHGEHLRIYLNHFTIVDVSTKVCDVITKATQRYLDRMFTRDCSKINPKAINVPIEYVHEKGTSSGNLTKVTLKNSGDCEKYPQMDMMEDYKISINKDGAEIVASSNWGILRGLETFSQLVQPISSDVFIIPMLKIEDYPRFTHRGLLIDSSRHFLSMRSIYDTIDAMEMNKMNVLHWHIVDDQSFPYVSEKFPKMSEKGSFNAKTHVYTQKDVQDVIEYSRERGIRVLSEFDTPGHVNSWGKSIEGLLTQCYDNKGHIKPGHFGPINPIKEENYHFIKEFFTEISQKFPDKYLHLGGDEVPFDCWKSNPEIKEFMKLKKIETYEDLESFYIQKLLSIMNDMNRSYIVWQEVFDNHVKLAPKTVVHVWKGHNLDWQEELTNVTKNYHALLSSPWYLNYINYGSDWHKYYAVEPLSFKGDANQKKMMLGGEACMWGELVDSSNLISRTWPRASAVAERLWSHKNVTNIEHAQKRIFSQQCRMQKLGLRVEPINGPGHCSCDPAL